MHVFFKVLAAGRFWGLTAVFLLCREAVSGQDWSGYLLQQGSMDTFAFSLQLEERGGLLTGFSVSKAPNGKIGRFTLAGSREGNTWRIQEIEQLEPRDERWCKKYLVLEQKAGVCILTGLWQADGCPGGTICLTSQDPKAASQEQKEIPFSLEGLWTGHLSQADRDYGFYYEMQLGPDGAGFSSIVSEAAGGKARHQLAWNFQEADSLLHFAERAVTERTDPNWKWCIKAGNLTLSRDAYRYVLRGDWGGYIEGNSPGKGACAPGSLYLEKPILSAQDDAPVLVESRLDSTLSARSVKLERSIEVTRPQVKLRLWDNGTEDGDVVSLYLNGKRIAHKFRVTKGKASLPVTLDRSHNILVLYAENLGSIPPNTVALSVDDGVREQVLVLTSDLTESGAVLIRYFTVK